MYGKPSILKLSKSSTSETKNLQSLAFAPNQSKVSVGIDKNSILSKCQDSCIKKGFKNQTTTMAKGEIPLTPLYSLHYCLITDCKMKPSSSLYYWVRDLCLDNMMIFFVKSYELYFTKSDLVNLKCVNKMYHKMINNVLCFRSVDFSSLKIPRLNYADQTAIPQERVDLATACAIHYGLHITLPQERVCWWEPGCRKKLGAVLPYISKVDCKHIKSPPAFVSQDYQPTWPVHSVS